MNFLGAATFYVGRNMRVFPCRVDKSPATEHGFKDATVNIDQIADWWTETPTASIGWALPGNIVVLDVDIKHHEGKFGDESLADFEREHGQLPDTVTSLTGGGGVQYFFKTDKPVSCRTNVLPSIDVRTAGGYVILPPSNHPSGRAYAWESAPGEVEFAPLPDALYNLIGMRGKTSSVRDTPDSIPKGSRNDALFRLGCSLRNTGLSETEILAALSRINKERCDPPLELGEIKLIAASAAKYKPGAKFEQTYKPAHCTTTDTQCETDSHSVIPRDYSDVGNTNVFERIYGTQARWTRGGGWFCWDGKRWEQNDKSAVAFARELSENMQDEALRLYVSEQKAFDSTEAAQGRLKDVERLLKHANSTRRSSRIDAMLSLAESGLYCDLKAFDKNPLDLNTPAGVVDLATGNIRAHSSEYMCSKITTASLGNKGRELWTNLLTTISCDDEKLSGFLQQVVGMALIGKVYHEGVIVAYGAGRNGKSTFFNAIADVLGDYAGRIAVSTLTTERNNKGSALATMRGKRFVLTGEMEENQRLSVATVKALASTDVLVAEEKYRMPEEFKQTHTLCLFTNHLPRVGSTDAGTWRRLTVVPFEAVIDAKSSVQNYGELLASEAAPYILQWAVEGAIEFVKNGYKLIVPECVAIATEEYQARENWIANFVAECCNEGECVGGGDLYAAYRNWATNAGEYVRRQSDFVAGLESAGYRKFTSNGRNYWKGITLDSTDRKSTRLNSSH